MNFYNYYQQESRKTAIYPKSIAESNAENNLWYPALGLVEELGELDEAIALGQPDDVLKEAGDCLWYIAQVATEAGLTLDFVETQAIAPTITATPATAESKLCGVVKKIHRDKQGVVDDGDRAKIADWLSVIWDLVESLLKDSGMTPEQAMQANLAKLRSRAERGVLQGSGSDR